MADDLNDKSEETDMPQDLRKSAEERMNFFKSDQYQNGQKMSDKFSEDTSCIEDYSGEQVDPTSSDVKEE